MTYNFNALTDAPFVQLTGVSLNLPEYSGKGDELSFNRWYDYCVDELKTFGFQNEEQCVLLLIRQLRSNARQTYDAYKMLNNQQILTLGKFKDILEPKFIDDNYDIKLRYRLLNLKQSGTIAKYIEAEKDIFGNYKDMNDKDRIFYLMNNIKPSYLKILNKRNPKTYLDAINALIERGDQIIMNAALSGKGLSEDSMDLDNIEFQDPRINTEPEETSDSVELNLISVENGGKTFWVTVKETKKPFKFPLNTSHSATRTFLDNSKLCWNCGSKEHLRRDCKAPNNHRRQEHANKRNEQGQWSSGKGQRNLGVADNWGPPTPITLNDNVAPPLDSSSLNVKEIPLSLNGKETSDKPLKEDSSESTSDMDLIYYTASEDEDGMQDKIIYPHLKSLKKTRRDENRFYFADHGIIRRPKKFIKLSLLENHDVISSGNLDPNNPSTPVWTFRQKDVKVRALLDSGAKKCFVAHKLAIKLGATITEVNSDTYATVADGTGLKLKKLANIKLTLEGQQMTIMAYIFPLKHVDLILGINWWCEHQLTPEYKENRWSYTLNNELKYIQDSKQQPKNIISVNSLCRLVKRQSAEEVYIVSINSIKTSNKNDASKIKFGDKSFKCIVNKHKEIFEETHYDQIPERKIEHEIKVTTDLPITKGWLACLTNKSQRVELQGGLNYGSILPQK
ncbi:hypothetical protein BB561_002729 [Smittium simulii]|uniref:CCHC-type domain-containing protein n=1 Tax=Smittium simulii TaxID=133385 RepID=A0A2T9YPF9_9FUNG|nr:hypothetical protein BB561_002729 [Smittium simulii]